MDIADKGTTLRWSLVATGLFLSGCDAATVEGAPVHRSASAATSPDVLSWDVATDVTPYASLDGLRSRVLTTEEGVLVLEVEADTLRNYRIALRGEEFDVDVTEGTRLFRLPVPSFLLDQAAAAPVAVVLEMGCDDCGEPGPGTLSFCLVQDSILHPDKPPTTLSLVSREGCVLENEARFDIPPQVSLPPALAGKSFHLQQVAPVTVVLEGDAAEEQGETGEQE